MRWNTMRWTAMDVNHPYLSHPVRGWGRSLGAQSRQLAVSGLLPVQRGVIHSVCGARSSIRTRGADGGTVKSPHAMFWPIKPRARVRSVGGSHVHPPLLQQVWVCIQALVPSGQTVALPTQVLIRLDVPSLQDGAGAGRDGACRGVGIRQPVSGDGGAAGHGGLPRTEWDSGGGRGHGVGRRRGECCLHWMVRWGTHGGLS